MQKPQSSLQKSRTIGNYIITKNLGQGTFGKVKLGIHSVTGQKVAIKILEKSKIIDVADVQRVTRQIHILKQIRHPNLIQLYEIIETPKQLFLVMEYVSQGELFEHIVKKKRLKQNEACEYFRQLIDGIEYLHDLGIVHRDLKPENLLIDFNKRLKIVDFGLSNTYKNKQLLKTACGSPCYAAPQMIAGKKYHGLMADIWSCGVILFAMVCGYLPFEDPNTSALYKKITACDYTIPKFVSPFAKQLLQRILTTDPDRRIKISQIKKHAWYRQPIDLQFPQTFGIKVGINNIPIDQDVLAQLISTATQNGYQQTRKFIQNNRHNHVIAIYYLLLKQNLRNGIVSKYDICSPMFDPANLEKKIQSQAAIEGGLSNNKNLSDDIEEIQLDRLTTATGPRAFRAFSRGNSIRTNNTSQSPDITAHNFYINKNKNKTKKQSEQATQNTNTQTLQTSQQFNTIMDNINNVPSTQRRKIYFQAPTKNILTNSIDLKSLRMNQYNNPQMKSQRPGQKDKLQISLYDIEDKRQQLSHFYHHAQTQDKHSTLRQSTAFRTSINRSYRVPVNGSITINDKKSQQGIRTARQSATRDGGIMQRPNVTDRHQRYVSLDVNQLQQSAHTSGTKPFYPYPQTRKGTASNSNPRQGKEMMNKTFMGNMTSRIPKNQSQRIKSILNNTITAGFGKRRTISTRQRDY